MSRWRRVRHYLLGSALVTIVIAIIYYPICELTRSGGWLGCGGGTVAFLVYWTPPYFLFNVLIDQAVRYMRPAQPLNPRKLMAATGILLGLVVVVMSTN